MPDSNIIQIDQNLFETKLDRLVTEKMTQILNAMLDAEADEIANAAGYERRTGRKAFRAGHYGRTLAAKAGKLSLKVPELKGALFGSAVIERCRRRESSVEEALMEMYLAGVGTRRVDDTGRLLWGGHVENAGVLVAIGVGTEGRREVIAVDEGMREGVGGTATYLLPGFPANHRIKLRTDNMIERLNKEIRRRTRVVGGFPDSNSALMLVCARIRYVTSRSWSDRRYMDTSRLDDNLGAAA